MDEKEKTLMKAGIGVTLLVIVWLILRSRPKSVPGIPPSLNAFQVPYFTTNPGVSDNPWVLNGGQPTFTATNTINVNTGAISGLSNAYMPMFGLVGMTAVSG